LKEKL